MLQPGHDSTTPTPPYDPVARERAAFSRLAPVTPDYPLLPIADGFNWSEALAPIESGSWYLVVFRSVRARAADVARLTEFDDHAHREALATEGLLFYFKGQLNRRRECLSFCVWQDQQSAQAASSLPLHQSAVAIVGEMYDSYRLERYHLSKERGSHTMRFERLLNEPVG